MRSRIVASKGQVIRRAGATWVINHVVRSRMLGAFFLERACNGCSLSRLMAYRLHTDDVNPGRVVVVRA